VLSGQVWPEPDMSGQFPEFHDFNHNLAKMLKWISLTEKKNAYMIVVAMFVVC